MSPPQTGKRQSQQDHAPDQHADPHSDLIVSDQLSGKVGTDGKKKQRNAREALLSQFRQFDASSPKYPTGRRALRMKRNIIIPPMTKVETSHRPSRLKISCTLFAKFFNVCFSSSLFSSVWEQKTRREKSCQETERNKPKRHKPKPRSQKGPKYRA